MRDGGASDAASRSGCSCPDWLSGRGFCLPCAGCLRGRRLKASDYKMAGDATQDAHRAAFRPRARPEMVPAARPAPAGRSTCRKRTSPSIPRTLKARGLVTERPLRRARTRGIAADSDGERPVRRRQGSTCSPTRRATASGWSPTFRRRRTANSTRRWPTRRRPPARPCHAEGRPGRHAGGRSGQALHRRHRPRPWRHRRRRRRHQRHRREERHAGLRARNCGTSSPQTGKYDVFMTRETDEFLRLDDRVRIARQHEADLFISIHADTISRQGHPRRHRLHGFRQGVRCRSAGARRSRKPLRPARRHRRSRKRITRSPTSSST